MQVRWAYCGSGSLPKLQRQRQQGPRSPRLLTEGGSASNLALEAVGRCSLAVDQSHRFFATWVSP